MMRKIFVTLAAASAFLASQSFAIDVHITDANRAQALEELAADQEFAKDYLKALVERHNKLSKEDEKRVENMATLAGMTQKDGMMKNPPVISAEPEKKSGDGMISAPTLGMQKPKPKMADEALAALNATDRSAVNSMAGEQVDLFMSLACPYCKDLWKNVRAQDKLNALLKDGTVNLWLIPQSPTEAGVILLQRLISDQNRDQGLDVADFLMEYGSTFSGLENNAVFATLDKFLAEKKYPSVSELKKDVSKLLDTATKLQVGVERAGKFNMRGFPSLYINGVEDKTWFARKLEADNNAKTGQPEAKTADVASGDTEKSIRNNTEKSVKKEAVDSDKAVELINKPDNKTENGGKAEAKVEAKTEVKAETGKGEAKGGNANDATKGGGK